MYGTKSGSFNEYEGFDKVLHTLNVNDREDGL